ncbi:glutamate racemase [Winogradskyella immobilis]|uniref:Glutamate racemase n=1 Tax=Winogradskyella immobilis TaxID=2816852 RepID=A0ABS8EJ26_9FLAO|nr:glutamate racemase [Winogradskyella immobilis]MCC1483036.1 glutamate racemase [Winogradskyella immobilis]MCG0015131.1 glutamate racemase [Winogradskyella immobilis]
MCKEPIGIFDSGIGGTSIFKEINTLLPYEAIIYLADSKNAPYGNKSAEDILQLSIKNTELLINKGCKVIVVACNTATTNAIDYLRKNYNTPFIGIEPAIKPASLKTTTKSIGILATKGTLSSSLFHETSNLYSKGITIIERIGEGIVPLIEAGKIDSDEMRNLLLTYTQPMLDANIDYLVLGCTHYPYLIPLLTKILPQHIKIIDSGLAVAKQTKSILEQACLLNKDRSIPKIELYTNKDTTILENILNHKFKATFLDF